MSGARVLLMGMMGSGKTTVGRLLSERTGWPYLDNDELLRELGGADTEALSHRGEDVLHRLEADVVLGLLDRPGPLVAGLAASVVTFEEVRRRLRAEALGVYLHASVEVLAKRVGEGEGRPWLKPDPVTALRRLYEGREPLYREAARLVVDVDELTPEQAADRILAEVR
jgi:shikimate kinase